jgi:hypothetical protein
MRAIDNYLIDNCLKLKLSGIGTYILATIKMNTQ